MTHSREKISPGNGSKWMHLFGSALTNGPNNFLISIYKQSCIVLGWTTADRTIAEEAHTPSKCTKWYQVHLWHFINLIATIHGWHSKYHGAPPMNGIFLLLIHYFIHFTPAHLVASRLHIQISKLFVCIELNVSGMKRTLLKVYATVTTLKKTKQHNLDFFRTCSVDVFERYFSSFCVYLHLFWLHGSVTKHTVCAILHTVHIKEASLA